MPRDLVLPAPTVHGAGLVELFDERGRLIERHTFENFVGRVQLEHYRWAARRDFAKSMGAPGISSDPEPWDPMSHLILSSSGLVESPDTETDPPGSMIGWANKTPYSGVDTLRGTPNYSESLATPTATRWVFDWPTTAGNGTFQSIMWCPAWEGGSSFSGALIAKTAVTGQSLWISASTPNLVRTHAVAFEPDGTCWIAPTPTSSGSSYGTCYLGKVDSNFSASPLIVGPTGANLGSIGVPAPTGSAVLSMAIAGSDMWVCSGAVMRRFAIPSGGGAPSSLQSLTAPDANVWSLSWDGTMLWCAGRSTGKVFRFSATDGSVDRQWSPPGGQTPVAVAWDAGRNGVWVVTSVGKLWLCDLDGAVLQDHVLSNTVAGGITSLATGDIGVSPATGKVFQPYGGALNTANVLDPAVMGTRSRLGAPITKTNLQSMKITYEFTFV